MNKLFVLAIGLATALPFAISQNNTVTLEMEPFDKIELAIDAELEISEGNEQSVTITGPQSIIDEINTDIWDSKWEIKLPNNQWAKQSSANIKIKVTVQSLEVIGVSGNGYVEGKGRFSKVSKRTLAVSGNGKITFKGDADYTHIALSGSGYMDIESNGDMINCALSGSGNIDLNGTTKDLKIAASGSGSIGGPNLKTNTCNVVISGSSVTTAHVVKSANMIVSGSGYLAYKGNPKITKKSSNGSNCAKKFGS